MNIDARKKYEIVFILILTLIAFYLRVRNVGLLGFAGDEELTILAVKGLLDHGYPVMPSGMPYLRGFPFSYIVALSIKIFGESEFAVRLPSVIFGTIKVPLFYVFCRNILNREVGVLAAILITFSVWDIQVSRLGRMYSAFSFFYLLSMYVFYLYYVKGDKKYLWIIPMLFVITTCFHQLGIFLLLLFLFPMIIRNYITIQRRMVWLQIAVAGVMDFAILKLLKLFEKIHMNKGADMEAIKSSQNVLSSLTDIIPEIYLPKQDLFMHAIKFHPYVIGIFILLCTAGIAVSIKKRYPCFQNVLFIGISVSLFVTLSFQLYGFAFVILLIYLKRGRGSESRLIDKEMILWIIATALSFVVWFLYGYIIWQGYGYEITGEVDLVRKIVKSLSYYPPIDIRTFVYAFPKMTVIVSLALFSILYRFLKKKYEISLPYLCFAFIAPLLLFGLMKEWTQARYSFHLYPLFLMIFSWIVCQTAGRISRVIVKEHGTQLAAYVYFFCVIVLAGIIMEHNWIGQAYAVSNYSYGDNTHKDLDGFISYPDHKGAGLYVKQRLQEQDVVIAEDLYQQTYYVGWVDYRIKSLRAKHKSTDYGGRNIYTGAETIHDLYELLYILNNKEGRVWIILSGEMKPETRELYLDKSIEDYLLDSSSKLVYKGRDRRSNVYLFNNS